MPIELHCHSTASDGELEPRELVSRAVALGLTSLSLTDHDTVAGVAEVVEAAKDCSLRVIPGVELSCHFEGREVHVLGYFFEYRDPEFLELLQRMQTERRDRVRKILRKLESLGVGVTYEEVESHATGSSLGRPHVAKAVVAGGFAQTIDQAFQLYLGNQAPAYVGRSLLSVPEGIEALRRAGGCSVIAHPALLKDWAMVERMMKLPVSGLEVWHPSHGKAARKRAKKLGGRYDKVLTGGSDFHRAVGDYHELGSSQVTEKVVTRLLQAAKGESPVAS